MTNLTTVESPFMFLASQRESKSHWKMAGVHNDGVGLVELSDFVDYPSCSALRRASGASE